MHGRAGGSEKAAELDLKLGFEVPETLTFRPANRCPVGFAMMLRTYKRQLVALLRLPFCMVYSEALQKTIFFWEDEDTTNGVDGSRR